jgi:hypothetical protein
MRFDVLTLFPELFAPFMASGVTRRAYESKQVEVVLWNPRDFAQGNYKRVDDRPFGGGPGMVMMAEPLTACLDAALAARGAQAPVVLFSPIGEALRHEAVERWSASEGAVLVCGRYEGIDQRFIDTRVSPIRSASATSSFQAARSRPWRCSTPWRGCSPACWATRPAMCRTASTPRSTACSTARTTPGPSSGTGAGRSGAPALGPPCADRALAP